MNPTAILIAAVVWLASLGGAFWYGTGVGSDGEIAKQAHGDQVRQQTFEAAQAGAAAAIAANRPRNTTIRQETRREIQTDVRYVDCKLTDGVLRNINEALTGKPAGADGVPGAATPR